ncbi:hypothetical protein POK33_39460 [Burkholderia cenocepacia]|uniref:hypothetical protein n=1 Tax=Burkholderia cenocepacia TaxID=95486 RepID=UPI0023B9261E|nr:hypothetical protein [Burkholderia cenocepacia]MDF0506833.1 hypothetical protein [Burkholderia cenocepacia]
MHDVRRSIEEAYASVRLAERHNIETALRQPEVTWSFRRSLIFCLIGAVLNATLSALIWIAPPHIAGVVGHIAPFLASLIDLHEPAACVSPLGEWYLVKRVVVGYLAVLALLVLGSVLCLLAQRYFSKRKRRCRQ